MDKPVCDLCGDRARYKLQKEGNTLKICRWCLVKKDTDKIAELVENGGGET